MIESRRAMRLNRLRAWWRLAGLRGSPLFSRSRDGWSFELAILALSCALGLAYAFVVVGPRVLNPHDVSWVTNDPATEYLGWAFFRREPHLTLPLGWSDAIGYPLGEPIAFLDSIPILATIFWLISDLLPDHFQYLGINFAFCCVLQFYFGFRISRRICGGSRIAGLLGAAFFLTAPAFTWRAFGHFALVSQWVILAAFDQFLQGSERPSREQIAWRAALCFIAGGINPYLTVMTYLVLSGTYLRTLLCQRSEAARLTAGLGVAVLSGTVSLMLFGFLQGADATQYAGGGYGLFSMNLLAPIDPTKYGALLFKQQPVGPGQYEGYNYLGLGVLLTGLVALANRPPILRCLASVEAVPAIGIFLVSLLLALSTFATAGHALLWHFEFPPLLMGALSAFRASGRLFWPAYYILFIAIIWAASKAFPRQWLPVVLAFALVVQILDLGPLRRSIREQWRESNASLVSSDPAWHVLGRTQRHLVVVPPWQCLSSPSPEDGYFRFGSLAVEQHMTTNSFYAGRYSRAQTDFFCKTQTLQIQHEGLQMNSAYIFDKKGMANLVNLKYNGKYCRQVDQFILCSDVPGKSGLDASLLENVAGLHNGDVISFATDSQVADSLTAFGWALPEAWGRWMQGHAAAMVFKVAPHPQRDVRLVFSIFAYLAPSHPVQHVDVQVNGMQLAHFTFDKPTDSTLQFDIPSDLIGDDGLIRLTFNLPDAASPASFGESGDDREISIGIRQLRVDDSHD